MKTYQIQINSMRLMAIISFSFINSIFSQSIQFQYSQNGTLTSRQIGIDKKEFEIIGSDVVCKGKSSEFSVSTGEMAQWSNGTNAIKSSYIITKDTIIKAIVTNKYGCEFEKTKFIKVANLPAKPIIERFGDSLIVNNVVGNFEWYRNGKLFNVGLKFIRTSLEGDYTVKVLDTNGCENTSDIFIFIISSTFDPRIFSINVYPNPTSRLLNIQTNGNLDEIVKIALFSLNGEEYEIHLIENRIDISSIPNGMYLLKFQGLFSNHQFKIIKMD